MGSTLNIFDRFVGFFSAQSMIRRAQARAAVQVLDQHMSLSARRYDGASKKSRMSGWKTTNLSGDSALESGILELRNRSHDLIRNNPYARRAVSVITSNTIGTGIVASLKPINEVENDELQKQADNYWMNWADTKAIDFEGRFDFYGMQSIVMRSIVSSGWVFVRRRRRAPTEANPLGLHIQILEADYLDLAKTMKNPENKNDIINGVEIDSDGVVVAYWLFPEHPGAANKRSSYVGVKSVSTSNRLSAEDVKIVFKPDRPGQNIAAPWLSPIVVKVKDFEEYQDATLLRQKIAACYALFIIDSNPGGDSALVSSSDNQGEIPERVEPGMVEKLGQGQDVRFATPPGADGSGDFNKESLRAISIGLDIPYEALTGDLSNVNFSSGRMGWLEFHRNIEQWRWNMIIPQFCDVVWMWFKEAAAIAGKNPIKDFKVEWTPPAREMIDPNAETNATIAQVRGGFMTLSEAIRQRGLEPKKVFLERQKEHELMDKMGLVFDSDPRKIMKAGIAQTPDALAAFLGTEIPGDSQQ